VGKLLLRQFELLLSSYLNLSYKPSDNMAQCHHPPIMAMYTMYHPLMIILVKDLDIFEVFNKIKEFKALIREPFCKED
jgi:hypothetical protein